MVATRESVKPGREFEPTSVGPRGSCSVFTSTLYVDEDWKLFPDKGMKT